MDHCFSLSNDGHGAVGNNKKCNLTFCTDVYFYYILTGNLRESIRASQQQSKVVTGNIENVEFHYPQFIQDINLYTIRSAKLRDAGDSFAKSLQKYAQSETSALKHGLSCFAECFAAVQDHRNALVNRLENKVVVAFSVYETRCKQVMVDVEQPNVAYQKETSQYKSFEKVKSKSIQHHRLAKAEAKFKKASEEAIRSRQILCDQVSEFERGKVRDLKYVFGELLLSEMLFYSKALELYTRGYQELMKIDEEENIGQLQNSMNYTDDRIIPQILHR